MKLVRLFDTKDIDGTVSSFVGLDLQNYKCYSALSFMTHGYGGAYGEQVQIGNQLTIEEVRAYAQAALEEKADARRNIEPFLEITEEELINMYKKI